MSSEPNTSVEGNEPTEPSGPTEAKTTLLILFGTPGESGASSVHERKVKEVPASVAERVAKDFVQHGRASGGERYKLSRVGRGNRERLIALDFEEVVGVLSR